MTEPSSFIQRIKRNRKLEAVTYPPRLHVREKIVKGLSKNKNFEGILGDPVIAASEFNLKLKDSQKGKEPRKINQPTKNCY